MKIRTQLKLLIIFMAVMPFFCAISIPVYHYFSSPQRFLLKGYKAIRAMNEIDFTDDDWDDLKKQLETIPPNVQTMVYYNSCIILSSIQELKPGTPMTPLELFEFIRSTSDIYDYQMQTPQLNRNRKNDHIMEDNPAFVKFLVISRSKVPGTGERRHPRNYFLLAFLILVTFEISCAIFLINLSQTIASSITLLEESTQKIAAGELDTKIETPKQASQSNEITSLTESLEKMRKSLKEDQERKSKFIMGISHDLRTPVALIKGYTEAITDGVVNDMDSVKKSLSIIHSKADQLESMINDLINYVKLNNTDWRQTLEYVAVEPVLKEFASSACVTAEVYKRTILTAININSETKIRMDKNLFNRALENIFSNALRYTSDGDTISITADQSTGSVMVSISDTGTGISEKDLEHIYDIFYRGSNSRREGSMGIGLSVVKTIIDTHGWKIDVQSKLQEGTTFTITIPVK